MKLNALLKGLILSVAVSASAHAQLIEKTLENGIDAAILDAFKDAVSSSAIDDISSISLTDVKGALNSIKIDGANLIVDFDDEKISSLLNNKGIASWSGLSDPVLVWLANVNEEGMTVMGGDNEFEFAKALNSASNLNSYNLMFPIMDLTDMQEVSAQTILSHSDSQLVKASKRYDAKYFVAGAVEYNAETETYSVKWNAYSGEGNILGSGSLEGDLDLVTQNMSREVAKVLMMNKPQNTVSKTSADEVEAITSIQSDGSITLGPVAGVMSEFVKIMLKIVFKPTSTAFVGELANFTVGCCLVLPATVIYQHRKSKLSALLGCVAGTVLMTIFGTSFNAIYLLPKFAEMYGMPLEALVAMGTELNKSIVDVTSFVVLAVAPLNIVKGGLVSIVTMLVYKPLSPVIKALQAPVSVRRKAVE